MTCNFGTNLQKETYKRPVILALIYRDKPLKMALINRKKPIKKHCNFGTNLQKDIYNNIL